MSPEEKLFQQHYKGTADSLSDTIGVLKNSGLTQMQTVLLLRQQLNIDLSEADKLVLYSEHWSDNLSNTIELRNIFEQVLKSCNEDDIPDAT